MVSVQDTEEGVKVTLIPMVELKGTATFKTKLIQGQRLSLDCGHQYFRCQQLMSVSTSPTITFNQDSEHVLLVPLQNGLLLLKLNSRQNSPLMFGSYRILANNRCSPTAVFRIYDSLYTMCTDLQNLYISLYEVRLNGTQIQEAQLFGPLAGLSSNDLAGFASSDILNMSDFLVYTDVPHQPLVYFAVDNYLFTLAPLDWSFYDEFSPIGARCRQIYHLMKVASTSQLLAYCSSRYVYYDTEYQNWLSEHTYENSGIPYICPDQTYKVIVHSDYLEYSIGSNMGTVTDVYFDNGLCLNSSAVGNYLAYIDKRADSVRFFVLNQSTWRQPPSVQSLRVGCSDVDCIPLLSIGDRYLVIQQAEGDSVLIVLDTDHDFRVVVNVSHQTPSLVTILQEVAIHREVVTSSNPEDGKVTDGHLIVIICVMTIVLLSSMVVLVAVFMLVRFRRTYVTCHRGK